MRRWWMGMGWGLALVLQAGAAGACALCSSDLQCMLAQGGAQWCISGHGSCALAGVCTMRFRNIDPIEAGASVQLTLLEDVPGAGFAPARVVHGAGPLSVGRRALRIARGPGADMGADAAIVWSGHGLVTGGTGLFRSPAGDGFAISRESDGRGARVRVQALMGSMPGRVLADERLDETDALVVRVPFENRTRVLVVQGQTLGAEEWKRRSAEAEREQRLPMTATAPGTKPPFELDVTDH